MTNEDALCVQLSWRKVQPIKDRFAELFFLKLFKMDPGLRILFTGDPDQRGVKLMQLVTAAVRALDHLDVLLPVIRELGTRQPAHGLGDEHYGNVGTALLWTLEHTLGAEFTPEMKAAWIKAYGVLSQTMRESALAHKAA